MRIYLAARYSRYEEMQGYAAQLAAMGHVITSRWIWGGHQISDDGLSAEATADLRQRFAVEDVADLISADAVISFTEQPHCSNSRGGRHVEFGLAIAHQKRLIVVGYRENIFHCLPGIEFFGDWESCLQCMRSAEEAGVSA